MSRYFVQEVYGKRFSWCESIIIAFNRLNYMKNLSLPSELIPKMKFGNKEGTNKISLLTVCGNMNSGKIVYFQVPDTVMQVLDNTKPFLQSGIMSFWITLVLPKKT